jgi:hypothetical protein
MINVFCKVGFSSKKWGVDVHFHEINGKPYGWRLQIHDGVKYLRPYSLNDLLTGNIPYDQLPDELQAAIWEVAQRTFAAMERANPDHIKRDEINSVVIAFELSSDTSPARGEDSGGEIMH